MVVLAATTFVVVAGCSKSPPPVVEVTGVLLLDGKPLPHAKVEFIPQLSGFGAETKSMAITDNQGRFTMLYGFQMTPGAVVGPHQVLVTEGPAPADTRSQSAEAQARLTAFQAALKNRPIPPQYGNAGLTPLKVEVKADQKEYKLEMFRSQ
jgi:hypothetical protein